MHKHIKIVLIFLFVISINYKANSQVIDLEKNDLLNGRLYQEEKTNIDGQACLFDNKFHNSSIIYNGTEYNNKLIKYDIYNQKIIYYQKIDSSVPRFILLNQKYLSDFRIKFHANELNFTNKFSNIEGLPKEIKYYELAYSGRIKYIVGRYKRVLKINTINNNDKYLEEEIHFLIINDNLYKIKNKRDIYSIYKQKKKIIKAFIKENKLNVTLQNRYDLIELLIFCESL